MKKSHFEVGLVLSVILAGALSISDKFRMARGMLRCRNVCSTKPWKQSQVRWLGMRTSLLPALMANSTLEVHAAGANWEHWT